MTQHSNDITPEERAEVEKRARQRVADWYMVDPSGITISSFEWSEDFGNYVIQARFEKGGRPQNAIGHTMLSTLNRKRTFLFIYDAGSGSGIFEDDRPSPSTEVQELTLEIPVRTDAGREVRLETRLRALIEAAEQVTEEMDDDGEFAVVLSERLGRLLGFARTDRRDLEQGGRI